MYIGKIRVYQAYSHDIAEEAVDMEKVLVNDIKRFTFDYIVQNTALSIYNENIGITYPECKVMINI